MHIPQVRARGILMWWGKIRFIYGYSVFYVGFIQLALVAVMAYETTVKDWCWQYFHIQIQLWQYLACLLILIGVGIIVEYVISIPALIAISNEQMYKHDSPIKTDFEDIKKEQANQKKQLEELNEKIDRLLK
jgi:hypothetical protein